MRSTNFTNIILIHVYCCWSGVGVAARSITSTSEANNSAAAVVSNITISEDRRRRRHRRVRGTGSSHRILEEVVIVDTDFELDRNGWTFKKNAFVTGDSGDYTLGYRAESIGTTSGPTAAIVVRLGGVDDTTRSDMSAAWRYSFTITGVPVNDFIVRFDYQVKYRYAYDEGDWSRVIMGVDSTNELVVEQFDESSSYGFSGWRSVSYNVGTLSVGDHYVDIGGTNNEKNQAEEVTHIYIDNVRMAGQTPAPSPPAPPPTPPPTLPPTPPPTPPPPTPSSEPGQWVNIDYSGSFQARHEACFVMVGAKAYLIGGRGDRRVDIYNPATQSWSAGADPGIELHHMQCVAVDNRYVYIPSSWTGPFPNEIPTSNGYVYDTKDDKWLLKPAMKSSRRRGGAAAIKVGRWIYISHGNQGGHGKHATTLGWLDRYHIDNEEWEHELPTAPNPRDHTGGALISDGRICVAGGRDGGKSGANNVILPTDCYDPSTDKWTVHDDIPQGRAGSAYGTTCDGKLMIAGGEGFGNAWDNVDVFDGNKWTSMDSLTKGVHGTGLAVHCECSHIHIASGSPNQGGGQTDTMETLYPGGIEVKCP